MFFRKQRRQFWGKKQYDVLDIGLMKLASFAFALFLAGFFPQIIDLRLRWLWFIILILAIIRPLANFSSKR